MESLLYELDMSEDLLSSAEHAALMDIRSFLYAPHVVQELLSAEKTPTLSLVLPTYEQLIVLLKHMAERLCKISHAICATINKLEEYFNKSRRNRVYSLAMGTSFAPLYLPL